jgi:integrase
MLPDDVAETLTSAPRTNPKYFFWTGDSTVKHAGEYWRRRLFKIFKKAIIVNGHSHRFHNTYAVDLLQAGVSMENVSTLLGHKSIRITERHYSP